MSADTRSPGSRSAARERRTGAQAAALHLMPEVAERGVPGRRLRHRLLGASLAALSTLVLLAAIAFPVWLSRDTGVASQVSTPATALPSSDLAAYDTAARDAAATPYVSAPVVLSYHDIRPDAEGEEYVVTPDDFEAQMQTLHRAGWRSLTLAQFAAYRAGDYTPPQRSFLLTFDDGTKGLWRYADPILERYEMSATSFLITGSVGTRQPYYLDWPEVSRMRENGRWSFGSHTHDLHHRTVVDARGRQRGALTHRTWTESGGRETTGDFTRRVANDLDRSATVMQEHGLPAPTALSYPFSDRNEGSLTEQNIAQAIIDDRFPLVFINATRDPRPADRRGATDHAVERLEILATDDHTSVLSQMQDMTTIPVETAAGPRNLLADAGDWTTPDRTRAPVRAAPGGFRPRADAPGFIQAEFAPARTGDWDDYTTSARVTPPGTGTVGVSVRTGSAQPVRVRVSARQAQVVDHDDRVVAAIDIAPSTAHDITVDVARRSTTVRVDGDRVATIPVVGRRSSTGGVALDWSTASQQAVVSRLSVSGR